MSRKVKMDKIRQEIFQEIKKLLKEIHNANFLDKTTSESQEINRLQAYSNFLNVKVNENMLKTVKNYHRLMIGFGVLNLVLLFINLYLFFNK